MYVISLSQMKWFLINLCYFHFLIFDILWLDGACWLPKMVKPFCSENKVKGLA
jgi:hypothetical protein